VALAQVLDVQLDCATCASATLRGLALVISACCVQCGHHTAKNTREFSGRIAYNGKCLFSGRLELQNCQPIKINL